jgi:hypothetical protein
MVLPTEHPLRSLRVLATHLYTSVQVFMYQRYHPAVFDRAGEHLYAFAMVDLVEELFKVQVNCLYIAYCDVVPTFL